MHLVTVGQRGCIMFSLDSLKTMLTPQGVSGNTSKVQQFLSNTFLTNKSFGARDTDQD